MAYLTFDSTATPQTGFTDIGATTISNGTPSQVIYNALGYDTQAGFFYAMRYDYNSSTQKPIGGNEAYIIGKDGEGYSLGIVQSGGSDLPVATYNAGDVSLSGQYAFMRGQFQTDKKLYVVDLPSDPLVTPTLIATALDIVDRTGSYISIWAGDVAFTPDGKLWGAARIDAAGLGFDKALNYLISIDVKTTPGKAIVDYLVDSNGVPTPTGIAGGVGAFWSDANGNLYGIGKDANDGNIVKFFEFDKVSGKAINGKTANRPAEMDGASCILKDADNDGVDDRIDLDDDNDGILDTAENSCSVVPNINADYAATATTSALSVVCTAATGCQTPQYPKRMVFFDWGRNTNLAVGTTATRNVNGIIYTATVTGLKKEGLPNPITGDPGTCTTFYSSNKDAGSVNAKLYDPVVLQPPANGSDTFYENFETRRNDCRYTFDFSVTAEIAGTAGYPVDVVAFDAERTGSHESITFESPQPIRVLEQYGGGHVDVDPFRPSGTVNPSITESNKVVINQSDRNDPLRCGNANDGSGDDDPTVTPITPSPSIALTKSSSAVSDTNGDGSIGAGDKIAYTFEVENTGNVDLTDVKLNDTKLGIADATCTASLLVGTSATCSGTYEYTLTQADVNAGKVENSATATGKEPSDKDVSDTSDSGNANDGSGDDDPTVTPITPTPSIVLTKSSSAVSDTNGDGSIGAGDKIRYTFVVENTGNVDLTDVKLNDVKLGIADATCTGSLLVGTSATCSGTFEYTLTQADVNAGKVENSATATGKDPSLNDVSDTSDSGNANDGSGDDDPTVTPLEDTLPIATNDVDSYTPGTDKTLNALSNDTTGDTPVPSTFTFTNTGLPSGATVSPDGKTVTVLGEGIWTVDNDGKVTFKPENGFAGNPQPVSYTVEDAQGNVSNEATITLTANTPNSAIAVSDVKKGVFGKPVTVDVTDNDADVDPTTVQIVDPNTGNPLPQGAPLVVPNEGTWTLNPTTGEVTFTPEVGFTGNPTPITYTVKDKNGSSSTATVTVLYPSIPPVLPPKPIPATGGLALVLSGLFMAMFGRRRLRAAKC